MQFFFKIFSKTKIEFSVNDAFNTIYIKHNLIKNLLPGEPGSEFLIFL